MIQAKLGLNWPSGFRGEDFIKSVGRSWQTEHVCSLNLTSISYGFWNKGRKVLNFRKLQGR